MGTSKSSNATTNQAYDNRSITEVLQEYDIDQEIDNSTRYDLDQEIDNSTRYDLDQEIDNSVENDTDIDVGYEYTEDNDTDIDLEYDVSSVLNYDARQDNDTEIQLSADQDNDLAVEEGAIFGGGDVTITNTSTETDAGAVEASLGFAGDVLEGYFNGVEDVLEVSSTQNADLAERAFASSVGGIQEQSNNQAKWAGLAIVVMAVISIFKPR